jgi:hypothetical protein
MGERLRGAETLIESPVGTGGGINIKAALSAAASPHTAAMRTKALRWAKMAMRPNKTTVPTMLAPQEPRPELKINAVICIAMIRVHRTSLTQNTRFLMGCPRAMAAAVTETVVVIRRSPPASIEFPKVEPDLLPPRVSRRLKISCP